MALTSKKRLFAEALLAGQSKKIAALAAGYSAASASAAGSRLAKDRDVLAYIERMTAAKEKSADAPGSTGGVSTPPPAFDLGLALAHRDPRVFLLAAMNDLKLEPKLRIDAAKALMPFEFAKKGEGGKKEQQADAAKKVASRFAPSAPPKLAAANGKKV